MVAVLRDYLYGTKLWHSVFKNRNELRHWQSRKLNILQWYRGQRTYLFPCPKPEEKINDFDEQTNALLTFIAFENKHASYLKDLSLTADSFKGLRVGDIGSGPFPTLLVFRDCERWCVDHLIKDYIKLGYPISAFEPHLKFLHAKSENIPVPDAFFDAIISRNALDHVDDFAATAREIRRVLKPDGILHILVNYHQRTATEPHVLNDAIIQEHFGALTLRKVLETNDSWGFTGGRTVLWSNAKASLLSEVPETFPSKNTRPALELCNSECV
jgi:SAM-dependent methyltransferase